MGVKRRRFFRDFSIQNKMLVIILPLIVAPMLIPSGDWPKPPTSSRLVSAR